jgi:hypothetical protein
LVLRRTVVEEPETVRGLPWMLRGGSLHLLVVWDQVMIHLRSVIVEPPTRQLDPEETLEVAYRIHLCLQTGWNLGNTSSASTSHT